MHGWAMFKILERNRKERMANQRRRKMSSKSNIAVVYLCGHRGRTNVAVLEINGCVQKKANTHLNWNQYTKIGHVNQYVMKFSFKLSKMQCICEYQNYPVSSLGSLSLFLSIPFDLSFASFFFSLRRKMGKTAFGLFLLRLCLFFFPRKLCTTVVVAINPICLASNVFLTMN